MPKENWFKLLRALGGNSFRSGIYLMQQSRDGKWNTMVADTMCLTAENTTRRRRMRNTMPYGYHESTRAYFNESVMFYEEASTNVLSS